MYTINAAHVKDLIFLFQSHPFFKAFPHKKALSNIYLSPILKKGVMALTFNPSTREAKTRQTFWVQG